MMMHILSLSTLVYANFQYAYNDFASWPTEFCQRNDLQQSPVDFTDITVKDGTSIRIDFTHSTDFIYYPRTQMYIEGDITNGGALTTGIVVAPPEGVSTLADSWDVSFVTSLHFITKSFTRIYTLHSIQIKYGQAEHVSGYATDGSFQVLFNSGDRMAIIELPFKFDSSGDATPWVIHNKCANEYEDVAQYSPNDIDSAVYIDADLCGLNLNLLNESPQIYGGKFSQPGLWGINSPHRNVFDLLLNQDVNFDSIVHYTGSNTDASSNCSPDLVWFVHTAEPYLIQPIENFDTIKNFYTNEMPTNGNYRSTQPILDDTVFYKVQDTTKKEDPSGSDVQFAALTTIALAAVAALF